jgi:CBS-domain-containing membrane protein
MAQTTDPTKVSELKTAVAEDLNEIVNNFNNMLRSWEDRTSCVANFCWKYNSNTGKKVLSVDEIMLPIVVKVTPEEAVEKAQKILSEAEVLKCSPQ